MTSVSIVINTLNRAPDLARTLESFRWLSGDAAFEVVVVDGPSTDETQQVLERWNGAIRSYRCPAANLSMSRNIGIAASRGDVVAFIDDDGIPEPEWLAQLVAAYDDPEVGAAGGFVFDHTGHAYQYRFGTADRLGNAVVDLTTASEHLNFPGTFDFPHLLGTNSSFRRSALLEVGGFDEEFEYFLDETDVIARVVDAGYVVRQIHGAYVHHKFAPSHLRDTNRVLKNRFPVLKNKVYYCIKQGRPYVGLTGALQAANAFFDKQRGDVRWLIGQGMLTPADETQLEETIEQALQRGLAQGLAGAPTLLDGASELLRSGDFLPFETLRPQGGARCIVLTSRTYPPGGMAGIARYVHQLARALAAMGHHVHVLTEGQGHDRVDFEDRVWVHRMVVKAFPVPADVSVPSSIWDYSRTLLEEAHEIATHREITAVCAPVWDAEGIAFLHDQSFPLLTSLHTTLAMYMEVNPEKSDDEALMKSFVEPMLAAERRLMLDADGVLANSHAIVEEIERLYGMRLPAGKLAFVPHGMDDWTLEPRELPPAVAGLRLCFIGRLETRKGADVFLEILPDILSAHPDLHVDMVGNDRLPVIGSRTLREAFEAREPAWAGHPRLVFQGEVDEERLRGFFASADILVAPSRFESFGLVHLEGMMFGKPVIGCDVGGMKEVIRQEVDGLLVSPGDPESLSAAISRLIDDSALRKRLGEAARASYLERFGSRRMADSILACIDTLPQRSG